MPAPELALRRSKDRDKLLAKRGLKLTKFASKFAALTAEANASKLPFDTKKPKQLQTVWGILPSWLDWSGIIQVTAPLLPGRNKVVAPALTQRAVLGLVAAVFDPIGLTESFTARARRLLKGIQRFFGQHWDDQLPVDIAQKLSERICELPQLSEMTIPRSYYPVDVNQIELHLFGDSPQEVSRAVAVLRGRPWIASYQRNTFLWFVIGKAL